MKTRKTAGLTTFVCQTEYCIKMCRDHKPTTRHVPGRQLKHCTDSWMTHQDTRHTLKMKKQAFGLIEEEDKTVNEKD